MRVGAFLMAVWDVALRLVGALTGLTAEFSKGLHVLCALMLADYATGMTCALLKRSKKTGSGGLSARAGFAGLLKKGAMLLGIVVAAVLDAFSGGTTRLGQLSTGFYIVNELISIVENLACMGVPVPAPVRDMLDGLRKREGVEKVPQAARTPKDG